MEATVEQKLRSLYSLQYIDSAIDDLKSVRGELPLEVADLEDEIAGLETRLANMTKELNDLETNTANNKIRIKESQALVKKYDGQINKVKNNREYDALTKEIELQKLEIQAAEKRIKDSVGELKYKKEIIDGLEEEIKGRNQDLKAKKKELDTIVEDTQKEENDLIKVRNKALKNVEERLITAYDRIRGNMINGIAVAKIERDSCNGCFASLPPQRQIDIKQRKRIISCESCGRILVDLELADEIAAEVA